ncbi:hypothetical protein DE146DRAFT_608375 [Phaeosphaeria sp. MPI-PUGE-AT-0046c]|nr:hypothetical protein DE146DRAFT_608375 [Phaeosphaeria sp. MPI-PUGE-AT-0046c]
MLSFLKRTTSPRTGQDTIKLQPPARLPPTIHNEQLQSCLFTLAAEIRNDIYLYVFDSEFRELLSVESHPLSLLLSCRRIYMEASVLAFATHTFPISYESDLTANILTNSILLFPHLRRFEIRVLRGTRSSSDHNWSHDSHVDDDLRKGAVRKYAPPWFANTILRSVSAGWVHSWQEGQHWKVEWPQLEDWSYFDIHEECYTAGNMFLVPYMRLEAVGNVRGVHLCSHSCGQVKWLSADLVRETGRRVAIDAIYYGLEDRPIPDLSTNFLLKMRLGHRAVILKEGTPPVVPEAQSHDRGTPVSGITFEPSATYWDDLRVKNGDWKAKCRVALNSITGMAVKEEVPGSMALNEGDWARMTKEKESVDTVTADLGLARSSSEQR